MIKFNYKPKDINKDLAKQAHYGTSFTPDKRADQEVQGYLSEMKSLHDEFDRYAQELPGNTKAIEASLEQYRQKYIEKLYAKLSAQSRIYSAMIAGPSNYPAKRMEKRNATLDKRIKEFLEWREKALKRMRSEFNPAAIANAPIRSDEDDAIERLKEKIAEAERAQELMKAVNKIVRNKKLDHDGKVQAIKELGLPDDLLKDMGRARQGKFPAYMLTNNNANIRRMKDRLVTLQKEAQRDEVDDKEIYILGTKATLVENRDLTRLQLIFDGKPPAEVIELLKRNGFKWSRTEGAWQRLLNGNARRTVELMMD